LIEGECYFPNRFFEQQPATEFVIAWEDTLVYYISVTDAKDFLNICPSFSDLLIHFLVDLIAEKERLLQWLKMDLSFERGRKFFSAHPDKKERFPGKMIGNYLGMTPVMWSRIQNWL
jgi:hypothetical protein